MRGSILKKFTSVFQQQPAIYNILFKNCITNAFLKVKVKTPHALVFSVVSFVFTLKVKISLNFQLKKIFTNIEKSRRIQQQKESL